MWKTVLIVFVCAWALMLTVLLAQLAWDLTMNKEHLDPDRSLDPPEVPADYQEFPGPGRRQ